MSPPIESVESLDALRGLLAASHDTDVWFFKHSLTCGVSSAALREFERFAESAAATPRFALIEVQPAREVSRALAEQVAVRHESPQVILVRGGEAVFEASHWDITRQALAAAR